MKSFASSEIRNVAVVGHAHSGKTCLISAMLRAAGTTAAAVRFEGGGAVTSYDEEELERRMTMTSAVAFAEWKGLKVNLLDTPGFQMFVHEARAAMMPAETALLVINAQTGVERVTDRVWQYAAELNLPRVIVVNQLDHPKLTSNIAATIVAQMQERWGRELVPVQLPILDQDGFHGVVDLVTMSASLYNSDANGKGTSAEIPEWLKPEAKAAHEALVELVAEGKDELMEEFFAVGTIPEEHLISALHEAIREDRIFPILFASAVRDIGSDQILDFLKVYAPSSAERAAVATMAAGNGANNGPHAETVMRSVDDREPLTLYVFKTMVDPFAGRISFFKVVSGLLKTDVVVENYCRGEAERFMHLSIMQGRKPVEVSELHAGDLGAVAKLRVTQTGDTLGVKGQPVLLEPTPMPEPAMTYAIEPRTRADEDKLAPALHKLMEEDLLLRFYRDPQTNDFLLAGAGQPHIEAIVSKLKRRYHTEVVLKAPKIPYRETIRARVEGHGRHKKQTGGHGQFGDCKIRMEPLPRGSGFEFVNDIFGGAIPRQFVPAVEKGVQESAARGYLAGYPVVDFRVTLFDGSYHDVDSSEMSFKMAGRAAFRHCMEQARPALLEPIMRVEIEASEEFAGALMGDLNSRRGRVQGMERNAAGTVIKAQAPMSEMLGYGTTLTSITQGRGSFRMEMDHYDVVPSPLAEKIASEAKRGVSAEPEE